MNKKTKQQQEEVKKEQQPLSQSPKREAIKKLCEELGIPYSRDQRQKGTASIHFTKKPKKD